jgi:hypothetical protein
MVVNINDTPKETSNLINSLKEVFSQITHLVAIEIIILIQNKKFSEELIAYFP